MMIIYVIGPSGCGKSTVSLELSNHLCIPFLDADLLHSNHNKLKMNNNIPLTDEDRIPWLNAVKCAAIQLTATSPPAKTAASNDAGISPLHQPDHHLTSLVHYPQPQHLNRSGLVIIACSALKRSYRDLLRLNQEKVTYFIYLRGSHKLLQHRLEQRSNHFFKSSMLQSQLDTLEDPSLEVNVRVVDIGEGDNDDQIELSHDAVTQRAIKLVQEWTSV